MEMKMNYEIRDGKEIIIKLDSYENLLCVWFTLRYNKVLSPFAKAYRKEENGEIDITVEL